MVEDRADAGPDGDTGRSGLWRPLVPLGVAAVVVGIVVALALSSGGGDGSLRTSQSELADGVPEPSSTSGPAVAQPTSPTTSAGASTQPSSTAVPTTAAAASPTTVTTAAPRPGARVQVKFADGTGVRLRDGRFVSLTGSDLTALQAVLARYPGTMIERLFTRSEEDLAAEKAAAEAATGRPQPDLNLYFRLTLVAGADSGAAIADLGRLAVVAQAYADPGASPPPAPIP